MRFTLNDIELNLTAGLLIKDGKTITIRAKTLLVLKYLINHQSKVVSKQEILASVWRDVIVQEQVLVQSIKEIRDLLGSHVIKTYPRQGYQWTAELSEITRSKTLFGKPVKNASLVHIAIMVCIVFIGLFLYYSPKNNDSTTKTANFSVAFLPVINDMPDDIHDWVPLQGMDYLTKTLSQTSQLTVIEKKQQAIVKKHLSDHVNLANEMGVNLVVKTRLLGYPQDFQLHYSLYLAHSIERGIIFSKTVGDSFDQLVKKIAQRFDQSSPQAIKPYVSDFSNEAFTRGIEHYLQREYQQATTFFSSALQSNENLLAARRYLAASYINSANAEQGVSLMKENILQAQLKEDYREEIRSNLMLGVLLINWYEGSFASDKNLIEAEQYIQMSKALAEQHQDLLFSAYAHEELAKIKRLQQHYSQATTLLKHAVKLYQGFSSDYGQTRPLIELALVANAQGKNQQAKIYFKQATDIANKNGVATNKVAILLAQADVQKTLQQGNSANDFALQALSIAQGVQSNLLITQVKSWLNNNRRYEIN